MAGPGVLVLFCILGLLDADDGSLGVASLSGPGPGVDAFEDATPPWTRRVLYLV